MPFQDKLWMGGDTLQINLKLFKENRRRLLQRLKPISPKHSIVFLQSGKTESINDSDIEYIFQQESYFRWTFGVTECDCYGAIVVETGQTILFFPKYYPEEHKTWIGPIRPLEFFKTKYGVCKVYYSYQTKDILAKVCEANPVLLILKGTNSDSNLPTMEVHFEGIETFQLDFKILFREITELRVIKTEYEIEVLKYVIRISSEAHKKVMSFVKPGVFEYQCEALFLHYCYNKGGCRHYAYECVCPSGMQSSILHYGSEVKPNDCMLEDGAMCLFDMGAKYFGYSADITCSFPVNGKFTADQKMIYEAVLQANRIVCKAARPGVMWQCMHLLSNFTLLAKLKEGGLLKGEVKAMMNAELGYVFQPHGLGHLLGLDVHDVGGYMEGHPERPKTRSIRTLRTARRLEKGMVITIEPGCYFVDSLLNEALCDSKRSQFFVVDVLKKYTRFGGVKIEDDVLITAGGVEILNDVPRTVSEIEDWMAHKRS